MALNPTRTLLRTRLALRNNWICPQCRAHRGYAADVAPSLPPSPSAPTLLPRLKSDLKTAMKAKDTNRLNVLRGLIAEITNSAKTSNPITTDLQLLSLLRKRAAAAKSASEEFKAAGRNDLVEKEQMQGYVLEEYAGSVETMSEPDIRDAVKVVVEEVKAAAGGGRFNMGDVLKKILGPGGSLEGKPVDRSTVARLVKQTVG